MAASRRHALRLLVDRARPTASRSRRRSPRRIRSGRSTATARPSWRSSARCRISSARTACAAIALRYFNAAGADPDGEIGEDHSPEIHLIPRAIDAAIGARRLRDLRRRLPDAGRHLPARLHPRDGSRGAHVLALEALARGRRSRRPTISATGGRFGARGDRRGRARDRAARCRRRSAPRRPGDPARAVSPRATRSGARWAGRRGSRIST